MGGDHKCPLCSATFTRPQHVGRHLRAHTGDRPYECKECPLRFARSDLLSRHVNKAHKPPDENDPKKDGKKGRRKSIAGGTLQDDEVVREKARRSSFAVQSHLNQPHPIQRPGPQLPGRAPSQTQVPVQAQAQLTAQRMYPHHPLLAGTPQPLPSQGNAWSSNSMSPPSAVGVNGIVSPTTASAYAPLQMSNPMYAGMAGNNISVGFSSPFTATPMRLTGSEQGMASSTMGRNTSMGGWPGLGFDFGFKKRACDQCNHSKVRCDFNDPCARCSHRNISCTYNKPSKARGIASPLQGRMSTPMFNSASNTTTQSGSSSSPNSGFSSSPHPTVNPTQARFAGASALRRQSVPSMPYGTDMQMAGIAEWNAAYQQNAMPAPINHTDSHQWQPIQSVQQQNIDPLLVDPASAAMGTTMGMYNPQYNPTATVPNPSAGGSLPMPAPHKSSSGSPPQGLAPTPSLTASHSTSPSNSDEPAERKGSGYSTLVGSWAEPAKPKTVIDTSSASTMNADPNFVIPVSYSPTSLTASVDLSAFNPSLNGNGTFAWTMPPGPAAATIDPRMQFRSSMNSDEDDTSLSRPASSAASQYQIELDENAVNELNRRRRSSAGTWASAFNEMTLQEVNSGATIPASALADPFTASQVAQTLQQKRPTFPMTSNNGEITQVPSMSDVKDLWKLFMSEPMTGPTPSGDKQLNFDSANLGVPSATATATATGGPSGAGTGLTPRPGMGMRTLSKSNSMPDLTSPMTAGTAAFFATFMNGITPRPMEPQASYLAPQQPAAGGAEASGVGRGNDANAKAPVPVPGPAAGADDGNMRKWKDQIQQRQRAFTIQPGGKMGKANSPPSSGVPPLQTSNSTADTTGTGTGAVSLDSMPPPASIDGVHLPANRPVASVLQHNSALQQTLAPERVPSFGLTGMTQSYDNSIPTQPTMMRPGPSRLQQTTALASGTGAASAIPATVARPGNKRLASSTLLSGEGKKATFTLFDGEDETGMVGGMPQLPTDMMQAGGGMSGMNEMSGMSGMSGMNGMGGIGVGAGIWGTAPLTQRPGA